MNILIIGNGFDLAHGLPTGYLDFMKLFKFLDFSQTTHIKLSKALETRRERKAVFKK